MTSHIAILKRNASQVRDPALRDRLETAIDVIDAVKAKSGNAEANAVTGGVVARGSRAQRTADRYGE